MLGLSSKQYNFSQSQWGFLNHRDIFQDSIQEHCILQTYTLDDYYE